MEIDLLKLSDNTLPHFVSTYVSKLIATNEDIDEFVLNEAFFLNSKDFMDSYLVLLLQFSSFLEPNNGIKDLLLGNDILKNSKSSDRILQLINSMTGLFSVYYTQATFAKNKDPLTGIFSSKIGESIHEKIGSSLYNHLMALVKAKNTNSKKATINSDIYSSGEPISQLLYYSICSLKFSSQPADKVINSLFRTFEGDLLISTVASILTDILLPRSVGVPGWKNTDKEIIIASMSENIFKKGSNPSLSLDDLFAHLQKLVSQKTKYGFKSINNGDSSPTEQSLSDFFHALNLQTVKNFFFKTEWSKSFKMKVMPILHNWNFNNPEIFDLFGKQADGTQAIPNVDKNIYIANDNIKVIYNLEPVTLWNWELQLEDFSKNESYEISKEDLVRFNETTKEAFTKYPEPFISSLLSNMKFLRLMTDNLDIFEEYLNILYTRLYAISADTCLKRLFVDKLPNRKSLVNKNITSIIQHQSMTAHCLLDHILNNKFFDESFLNFENYLYVASYNLRISSSEKNIQNKIFQTVTKQLASNEESIKSAIELLEFYQSLLEKNLHYPNCKIFPENQFLNLIIDLITKSQFINMNNNKKIYSLIQFFIAKNYTMNHPTLNSLFAFKVENPAVASKSGLFFRDLYSGKMSVSEAVQTLTEMLHSNNEFDNEFYAHLIGEIASEVDYFKEYPDDALKVCASFIGEIIKDDLITGVQLETFKNCMVNIIHNNEKLQNVFLFNVLVNVGEAKVEEFGSSYFATIFSECKGLRENLSFRNWIETVIAPKTKEVKYINPIKHVNFVDPSSIKLSEKLTVDYSFVLNNVSKNNITEMAISIRRIINSNANVIGIVETFAKLLFQRIKQDSNYHLVYRNLIYEVASDQLIDAITYLILTSAKKIFASSNQSTQDKKLLKNLGNWLGVSLIAKDKVISHHQIAMRELLLESWEHNYTSLSIPFICKIISYSNESDLFRIPNLWTNSILSLLNELNDAGTKPENSGKWSLKLTFEVELLYKNLKLSQNDIQKSIWLSSGFNSLQLLSGEVFFESVEMKHSEQVLKSLIKNPVMNILRNQKSQSTAASLNLDPIEAQQNVPPFNSIQHQQMLQPQHNVQKMQHPQQPQQQIPLQNGPQQQGNVMQTQQNEYILSSLAGNTMFVANPDLQVAFQMAIAKAIREILVTIVEKSATIAATTAKSLVSKDFATEADPELFTNTCVKTARQLAKSFAYINASPLLKKNIESTTKQLCGNVMAIVPHADEELLTAINDNINVAVGIIEKASMDKATSIVSELIIPDVAVRHHHINRRFGQKFHYNESTSPVKRLPEALSLNENGVTQKEFKIYESFAQLSVGADFSNEDSHSIPMINNASSTNSDRQTLLQQLNKEKATQQNFNAPQQASSNIIMSPENFTQTTIATPAAQQQFLANTQPPQNMMQNNFDAQLGFLNGLIEGLTQTMIEASGKPIDQEVIGMVDAFVIRIISGISTSKQKDNIALSLSQSCVSRMFQFSSNQLMVVVFTKLIQKICIISPVAKKDVNWWLVYSNDALKMNSGCLLFLIKIGLLEANQLDTLLSGLLHSNIPGSFEFVLDITSNIIRQPILAITKTQLVNTITLLGQVEDSKYKDMVNALFNDPMYYQHGALKILSEKDRYAVAFIEWVNLCETYKPTDLVCRSFIAQIISLIDDSTKFIEFFTVSMEVAIEAFKKSDPTGNVFNGIDALAYLVVQLLIFQDFKSDCVDDERLDFLKLVFIQFESMFTAEHNSSNFNERPFFRFISIVLSYWQQLHVAEFDFINDNNTRYALTSFNTDLYALVADVLHILQPLAFPGFTFAWISLLSHRMFLPIILKNEKSRGIFWSKLNLLLIDLFKFFIEYSSLGKESVDVLYKGTLRFMLLIANDCPEYYIENHYVLMNELPSNFNQIRNIVCAAIPLDKFFPQPMNQQIPIDYIPESCEFNPSSFVSPTQDLGALKKPIDSYLRIPSSSLLRNINNQILAAIGDDSKRNLKFINSIISHIVTQAGDEVVTTSKQAILNLTSSYFNLISNLLTSNIHHNKEVVYTILESLVNHLRFPNTQTYFVWYLLTTMFKLDLNDTVVNKKLNWDDEKLGIAQEMILRALMERLLICKPHPWGCVVAFMTILKNNDIKNLSFMKDQAANSKTHQLLNNISKAFEMPLNSEKSIAV
ncbi:hypothetical protein QEN19_000969 [Hanseniaspora menglaensis]